MTIISISFARQNLPELVNRAYQGEDFLVVKNKIPVAIITKPVKAEKKMIKRKIDPKVFGMWKNRWPENKSSVDIVNEWRDQVWKGRYGR